MKNTSIFRILFFLKISVIMMLTTGCQSRIHLSTDHTPARPTYTSDVGETEYFPTPENTPAKHSSDTLKAVGSRLMSLPSGETILHQVLTNTHGRSGQAYKVKVVQNIHRLLFDTDSADIRYGGEQLLDKIANILKEHPDVMLSITAHTDSTGSDSHNEALSGKRAAAVMRGLIRRGVASNRLSLAAMGSRVPVASNDTENGRTMNRRVEFIFSDSTQTNRAFLSKSTGTCDTPSENVPLLQNSAQLHQLTTIAMIPLCTKTNVVIPKPPANKSSNEIGRMPGVPEKKPIYPPISGPEKSDDPSIFEEPAPTPAEFPKKPDTTNSFPEMNFAPHQTVEKNPEPNTYVGQEPKEKLYEERVYPKKVYNERRYPLDPSEK